MNSTSWCSRSSGRWSEIRASIVPSNTPWQSADRSAFARKGGRVFKVPSKVLRSSSTKNRWCAEVAHVTDSPSLFASRINWTDSAELMHEKCNLPPVYRRMSRSRLMRMVSEAVGFPTTPMCVLVMPSCICGWAFRPNSNGHVTMGWGRPWAYSNARRSISTPLSGASSEKATAPACAKSRISESCFPLRPLDTVPIGSRWASNPAERAMR